MIAKTLVRKVKVVTRTEKTVVHRLEDARKLIFYGFRFLSNQKQILSKAQIQVANSKTNFPKVSS